MHLKQTHAGMNAAPRSGGSARARLRPRPMSDHTAAGMNLANPIAPRIICRGFVFVSGCLSHFLCFACFRDVFVKVCTPRGGGLASQHGRCEGNARGITQREHHATWLAVSLARRSTAGAAQAPTSLVAAKTRAVLPHAHRSVHRRLRAQQPHSRPMAKLMVKCTSTNSFVSPI